MSARLVTRVTSFGRREKKKPQPAPEDSLWGCAKDFEITLKKGPDGRLGLKLTNANRVTHVEAGAGAAVSGLLPGDRIISINNGVKLVSYAELVPLLEKMSHGVKVAVHRAASHPMGSADTCQAAPEPEGSSNGDTKGQTTSSTIAKANEATSRAVEEQGAESRDVDIDIELERKAMFRDVCSATCGQSLLSASQGGRIRRAVSFERKVQGKRVTVGSEVPIGLAQPPPSQATSIRKLSRSLSFGRRSSSEVALPVPKRAGTDEAPPMEMPQGNVRLEGVVWKKDSNIPRYRKRHFFVQGAMLCYTDPKSTTGENAIVYGPITAADIISRTTYELTLFSNERQLLMRVGTEVRPSNLPQRTALLDVRGEPCVFPLVLDVHAVPSAG